MKCVEFFSYEFACVTHGRKSAAKYFARLYVTEPIAYYRSHSSSVVRSVCVSFVGRAFEVYECQYL
jgi:hypothetical protein